MALHTLMAREVQTSTADCSDGGGLLLRVTSAGASRVYPNTAPDSRRREMGIGSALHDAMAQAGQSLADARKAADRARRMLADGVDPLAQRKADRDAAKAAADAAHATRAAETATLVKVARDYWRRVIAPQRTRTHAAQWIASLEQGVPPAIWNKPIAEVAAP